MEDWNLQDTRSRDELRQHYEDALLHDTLPFWFPRSIDEEFGGFLHCFDRDGSLVDTDKSVWAQGRMTWMLLTLYRGLELRPEWLRWAESGLSFLESHAFDADGRMFFHLDRQGRPLRKRRYAYSESFAAIAFAAHGAVTGNPESRRRAYELFELFTSWNFEPGHMPPKGTDLRPMIGLAPRMITLVTAQELRDSLGEDSLTSFWIDRAIDEIERWFYKPDLAVVMETVGPNGEILDHFDGRLLNPGHAIEGAWFILREARHRQCERLLQLGCAMLDGMWRVGWDDVHGGLYHFRDVFGKPIQEYWHDMKFWWPHDEAIIATLFAWTLTGESRYAEAHRQIHDWAHRHFGDPEYGEWFAYLHRDGSPSSMLKGNLWKSCFHHPRMQWWCRQLLSTAGTQAHLFPD